MDREVQVQRQGWQSRVGVAMEWSKVANAAVLVLPFFLWGTNMVVMEEVMPKTGALFAAAVRLIPAGALMVDWEKFSIRSTSLVVDCALRFHQWFYVPGIYGRRVDADNCWNWQCYHRLAASDGGCAGRVSLRGGAGTQIHCSDGFRHFRSNFDRGEKLQALLHSLFHGLLPGFIAMPTEASSSIWESGEWWMLLAAQSMAIGTVMIRWVSKFSDPVMVIGWHMVVGGFPVLAISLWKQDPGVSGHLGDLNLQDWVCLFYASVFGTFIATGLFFYNATRGSLTELSTLTLLTPVFAAMFGYLLRNETVTGIQLVGSLIVLVSICFVKVEKPKDIEAGGQDVIEAEYKALPADAIP